PPPGPPWPGLADSPSNFLDMITQPTSPEPADRPFQTCSSRPTCRSRPRRDASIWTKGEAGGEHSDLPVAGQEHLRRGVAISHRWPSCPKKARLLAPRAGSGVECRRMGTLPRRLLLLTAAGMLALPPGWCCILAPAAGVSAARLTVPERPSPCPHCCQEP